jgi:hypothetical protein
VWCVPASLCGLCIGRVIMYRLCMSVCGMYVHVCGVCMWCIWYVYVSLSLCVCVENITVLLIEPYTDFSGQTLVLLSLE